MADAGEERAAAVGARGHLRASRADRERVIELLKVAFVQDRLTQDELDTRVGLALASRTYADLADLTADIPAGSAAVEPAAATKPAAAAEPAATPARTLAKAAGRSGICMLTAFALVGIVALFNAESLLPMTVLYGIAAIIAASGFLGYGVVDAWQEWRSRGQLPPPRRGDGGLQRGLSGSTGRGPALPGARTDQTRTELQTRRPGRGRLHLYGRGPRAPRGIRSVPSAV